MFAIGALLFMGILFAISLEAGPSRMRRGIHTICGLLGSVDNARLNVNGDVLAIHCSVLNELGGRAHAVKEAIVDDCLVQETLIEAERRLKVHLNDFISSQIGKKLGLARFEAR